MLAGKYNLVIEQNATLKRKFTWLADGLPVDLTGYTCDAQVRLTPESSSILLDLVSYITLGGAAGTIDIEVPDEITAALTFDSRAYWDMQLINGGKITRLLQGRVYLDEGVTR